MSLSRVRRGGRAGREVPPGLALGLDRGPQPIQPRLQLCPGPREGHGIVRGRRLRRAGFRAGHGGTFFRRGSEIRPKTLPRSKRISDATERSGVFTRSWKGRAERRARGPETDVITVSASRRRSARLVCSKAVGGGNDPPHSAADLATRRRAFGGRVGDLRTPSPDARLPVTRHDMGPTARAAGARCLRAARSKSERSSPHRPLVTMKRPDAAPARTAPAATSSQGLAPFPRDGTDEQDEGRPK